MIINNIKDILFGKAVDQAGKKETESGAAHEKRLKIAACALLLEIAAFDGHFHDEEKKVINRLVKSKFGLTHKETKELIDLSHKELKNSIDLWQFTKLINLNYTKKERVHLIEMLWEVVYADEHLHGHEDFLVHKLAKLLKLQHKDLIGAKIRVKLNNQAKD